MERQKRWFLHQRVSSGEPPLPSLVLCCMDLQCSWKYFCLRETDTSQSCFWGGVTADQPCHRLFKNESLSSISHLTAQVLVLKSFQFQVGKKRLKTIWADFLSYQMEDAKSVASFYSFSKCWQVRCFPFFSVWQYPSWCAWEAEPVIVHSLQSMPTPGGGILPWPSNII